MQVALKRPDGSGVVSDAESDLQNLRSHVHAYFDRSRDCVFALNDQWQFIFLNSRALAEIAGGRDLVGTNLWESFPEAVGSQFERSYRSALSGNSWEVFEAYFTPLQAWYEVEAAPIDQGLLVTFRNINERKSVELKLRDAEERYRLAASATNDLIWDWDLRTGRVAWNDALRARGGYSTTHLGTTSEWWTDRLHPDDRDRVMALIHRSIESDVQFSCEYRFRKADGTYAEIYDRGYVLRDASGAPLRFVGAMQDLTERNRATTDLRERERQLATIFGQAMVGMYLRDLKSGDLVVNDRFCRIVGRTASELRHMTPADFTHPDDWLWNEHVWETHRAAGRPFQIEKRYLRSDGTIVWCNVNVSFVRGDDGEVDSAIVVADDITGRKRAEEVAREGSNLLQTVIDSVSDLIFVKDLESKFVLTNRALDEGCGELTGRKKTNAFSAKLVAAYQSLDREVIAACQPREVDEIIPINGAPRTFHTIKVPWVKGDQVAGVIGVSRDITERLEAEEKARWSASHDILTGLPNRKIMQESLSAAIRRAEIGGSGVALLLLDLDHFKRVNDALGHDAGDAVLTQMAERLKPIMRSGGVVGRIGGDEFAVLLPGLAGGPAALASGNRILAQLREPFAYQGQILDCRASIGLAMYPEHASTAEELHKAADMALYRSKSNGRSTLTCFDKSLRREFEQRTVMLSSARGAIAGDRIVPYYQPKVELGSKKVLGFEALLRWHDADKVVQLPGAISAAFEELQIAADLGERMLDRVLTDIRFWMDRDVAFEHVSLNASAAEFRRDDFAERVLEKLSAADIEPSRLQIEVVETVFLGRGTDHVHRALVLLANEGVRVALDDFGTGYASLRHLKEYPVSSLKIDQSFVRELGDAPGDAAIIRAMIGLGEELGLDVVAEGIETEAQALQLSRLGCRHGQGYLYSPAIPAALVPAFLSRV